MIGIEEISITLTLTEPLLGTVPKNKDVYAKYIATKKPPETGIVEDETETVMDDLEKSGWTGFHEDENGLFLYDYQVKGFLKEAGNVLKDAVGVKALKSKIENFVFIEPRRIHLGKKVPDGILERPLRAQTPMGERVALARSDYVSAGTELKFTLRIVPGPVKRKVIETILEYGAMKGLGQNRNSGYGRFTFEIS